jgi:hypothetical protein
MCSDLGGRIDKEEDYLYCSTLSTTIFPKTYDSLLTNYYIWAKYTNLKLVDGQSVLSQTSTFQIESYWVVTHHDDDSLLDSYGNGAFVAVKSIRLASARLLSIRHHLLWL